jgi:RNA polymerase sigma factor (sigma-70 family)
MQAASEATERHATSPLAAAGFDAFFADEHERLFRALYFITGDPHDAEELMQDAFLKVWERWDRVSGIEDPQGYLFRAALNGFRMRRRRAVTALRKLSLTAPDRDLYQESEMRADVRRMLLGLSPRQRAALVLTDLLGYSSDDAADILRIRPSTVRALATQGRNALRTREADTDA